MSAYLIVVSTTILLGLFVDESKLRSSIKLGFLYGWLMILSGWWLDWPAQLASNSTLLWPIAAFITSRIIARLVAKADNRLHDLPLVVYFSFNLLPAFAFAGR